MRIHPALYLLAALIAANLLAGLCSDRVIETLLIPYQFQYIAENLTPTAQHYHQRFAETSKKDWNSIVQELYSKSFSEIEINPVEERVVPLLLENPDQGFDVYLSNSGFVMILMPRNNVEITIGSIPGTKWIAGLPGYLTILFQVLSTSLVLLVFYQPLRHRIHRLLNTTPATITIDKSPVRTGSIERFLTEYELLQKRVEESDQQTVQRLDNQRDFLHGVAHEFRGPLTRLRFAAHLDDAEGEKSIDAIIDEMDSLVTEILEYSRYHHGIFEPNYARVRPVDPVKNVISRIQPITENVQIKVAPTVATMPPVVVDESLLGRCIMNLLLNAVRFARSTIEISGFLSDSDLILVVDDDGPGIPPGKKLLIFEPFMRLDPSRSRESGGSGLGLAIVKGIITRFGGKVSADDNPMGGARIVMRIPRNPPTLAKL